MSTDPVLPDYELDDLRVVTDPDVLKALFHPLRDTVLELLLERAASVRELATAIGRPPSTIAYHVSVLFEADLLRVVRTRRVRAVEERFYGRTARVFYVGAVRREDVATMSNVLVEAAAASTAAHEADTLRGLLRHARIPDEAAAAFWERVQELVREFSATPRGGTTTYAFAVGLYPSSFPSLADAPPAGGTTDDGDGPTSTP